MPVIVAYDIVFGEDLDSLCRRVNSFIKQGWQPLGQPLLTQSTQVKLIEKKKGFKTKQITTCIFYQTIIKYGEANK